jgi:hypothetical protein
MEPFTDEEIAKLTRSLAEDLEVTQDRTERAVRRALEKLRQIGEVKSSFVEEENARDRRAANRNRGE